MLISLMKLGLAAGVISFCSWLSGKKPELAGFIMALPIATLLVLPFSYAEYQDQAASVKFAQSIFFAVPLSLFFFVLFLFAKQLGWGFPMPYGSGVVLLIAAYFIHRAILQIL